VSGGKRQFVRIIRRFEKSKVLEIGIPLYCQDENYLQSSSGVTRVTCRRSCSEKWRLFSTTKKHFRKICLVRKTFREKQSFRKLVTFSSRANLNGNLCSILLWHKFKAFGLLWSDFSTKMAVSSRRNLKMEQILPERKFPPDTPGNYLSMVNNRTL